MRRSLIILVLGIAIVVAAVLFARSGDHDPTLPQESGLQNRSVSAGEVDIKIEPRRLDDQSAVFAITLNTHAVELAMDLDAADLEVDGISWPVAGWKGDGPSGHHREGDLRFETAGKAVGTAWLALVGSAEPVEVTWELVS